MGENLHLVNGNTFSKNVFLWAIRISKIKIGTTDVWDMEKEMLAMKRLDYFLGEVEDSGCVMW